mmetsp:Transcript_29824/g.44082  ORF Transcript_29824/g.44082 Transcript_29824/m.44082 type:complete len:86 (+) Transcript_29824:241-498(+)
MNLVTQHIITTTTEQQQQQQKLGTNNQGTNCIKEDLRINNKYHIPIQYHEQTTILSHWYSRISLVKRRQVTMVETSKSKTSTFVP